MFSYYLLVLTTGFALFCMFFGSGNLVYPLLVGTTAGTDAFWGMLGLLLTAVCVPLSGCLGILLYEGSPKHFFKFLGEKGFRLFALAALGLMGPFGVLARCLTVAHGTFTAIGWEVSTLAFSGLSCLVLWLAALYRQAILQLLGVWLTPLLLTTLAAILVSGLWGGGSKAVSFSMNNSWEAFNHGSIQGYQMMDLLAAFFFSGFVIAQLREKMKQRSDADSLVSVFIGACAIAGILLASVYAALVYLGAQYIPLLQGMPPENMLALVATHTLGSWGGTIACATFVLACYTTALVLAVLFAEFLHTELFQGKIPYWLALCITLTIAFFTSTLEFSGIAIVLGPLMEGIYPFLIAITVWNIAYYFWQRRRPTSGTNVDIATNSAYDVSCN